MKQQQRQGIAKRIVLTPPPTTTTSTAQTRKWSVSPNALLVGGGGGGVDVAAGLTVALRHGTAVRPPERFSAYALLADPATQRSSSSCHSPGGHLNGHTTDPLVFIARS